MDVGVEEGEDLGRRAGREAVRPHTRRSHSSLRHVAFTSEGLGPLRPDGASQAILTLTTDDKDLGAPDLDFC